MKILTFAIVTLSLLVLGAHFMRYGNYVGVVLSAAPIALLFVRRPWAARVVQVVLVFGAVEWATTLVGLVQMRMAQGEPATRLAIILSAVIIVTLTAALLFETQAMKRLYRRQ
jgi:hypothetical protein